MACPLEHVVAEVCERCGHVEELSWVEGGSDVPRWVLALVGAGMPLVLVLVAVLIFSAG